MPSIDLPATFERATQLQQSGRLAEAEALLRSIVQVDTRQAAAWNMLGVIRHLLGDSFQASAYLTTAVQLVPNLYTYNNLAAVLFALQRDAEGEAALKTARQIDANYPPTLSNLGLFYFLRGRFAESAAAYAELSRLQPDSGEIYFHLGNALWKAGDAKAAVAALRNSLRLQEVSSVFNSLGLALQTLGEVDEAIGAFQKALALQPQMPEALVNLGNTQRSIAQVAPALASFEAAVRAGNTFEATENILFTTHYLPRVDVETIASLHRIWGERTPKPAAPIAPAVARADRLLRVGFVSGDFNSHAAARFLLPLFQQLDRSKVQLYLYANNAVNDGRTAQFQSLANGWRDIRASNDDAAAQHIKQDKIDVLIDLSLHSEGNRLGIFARKPAPVQATWLGYASTTGLPTIDYRLSDSQLDPDPSEDRHYVEKTVRLSDCFWCFQQFDVTPAVGPSPAASAGDVTFGSLNNFAKVNTTVQRVWAKILHHTPNARIMIHSPRGAHREELKKVFGAGCVSSSRIEFVEFLPTPDYFALHNRIDIALDPFPFAGGTTTCDALWMGVPVVTLAGKTPTGRSGASILHHVGIPELIARSPEQYEQIAVELARDLPRLAQYRATLRERVRASPLTDAPRFARNFESAIRRMWLGQSE